MGRRIGLSYLGFLLSEIIVFRSGAAVLHSTVLGFWYFTEAKIPLAVPGVPAGVRWGAARNPSISRANRNDKVCSTRYFQVKDAWDSPVNWNCVELHYE